MSSLAQHVMMRLRDDRVIAPTIQEQRIVASVVLEKGRHHQLLAFSAADSHLHVEPACDRGAALEMCRRIEGSLKRKLQLEVGFAPAHLKPIQSQRHLAKTFDYILRQDKRHGLVSLDPGREASNLPDLLGMRVLGQYTAANVKALLPRTQRVQLLEHYGLEELVPQAEPLHLLLPSAAAAIGRENLNGQSPDQLAARRAVLEILHGRMLWTEAATLLGVSRRTVYRLRDRPVDKMLAKAILLQVCLRAHLGEREEAFTE